MLSGCRQVELGSHHLASQLVQGVARFILPFGVRLLEDCQALRAALHFHIPQLDAEGIKRLVLPDQQYYLEFFDQATGLLVKSENWALQGEQ